MADETRPLSGPRALGPFEPKVYVRPPKEASAPSRVDPSLTEGMKARRRELEKRRRATTLKRLQAEEESAAGWERARSLFWKLLFASAVVFGYWRLQIEHPDNRWPLELVWVFMVVGLLGGLGWTVWYMNRGD